VVLVLVVADAHVLEVLDVEVKLARQVAQITWLGGVLGRHLAQPHPAVLGLGDDDVIALAAGKVAVATAFLVEAYGWSGRKEITRVRAESCTDIARLTFRLEGDKKTPCVGLGETRGGFAILVARPLCHPLPRHARVAALAQTLEALEERVQRQV